MAMTSIMNIYMRGSLRQDRKLILIINFLFKNQDSNQCLNVGAHYLPLESKNIGHILKSQCMYKWKTPDAFNEKKKQLEILLHDFIFNQCDNMIKHQ